MKSQIFGKGISGLFTIPSGIITTEVSTIEKIAQIPEIGIITTKSIGPEPREGNREPILAKYNELSFVNAVGLTNPGADEFSKRLSKIKLPKDKFLLASIFGKDENEFYYVAKKLAEYVNGFEINVSCPHAQGYGQAIGEDKELIYNIVKKVRSLGKPIIVKISPNLPIKPIVEVAVEAGASGITAINTAGPKLHKHDGYPVLTNKVGGVSGKAILEIGLRCVKEVSSLTDLPIIACGGISCADDVKKYKKAGASFFGIGSALAGMDTEEIRQYFSILGNDLRNNKNYAEKLVKRKLKMNYEKFILKKKISVTDDIAIFEFDKPLKTKPGQFIFTWIPETGEKPFSVLDDAPLKILVEKKGCFTKKLFSLGEGDKIYVRGPYGKSPKINKKVLLVGGGTGIAGLYLFAKYANEHRYEVISLLGGKTKDSISYMENFRKFGKVMVATDNGSIGHHGFVTDLIEKTKKFQPVYALNCGPKLMVENAVKREEKFIPKENIYSSVETMTRCGIGLCGSCANSRGLRTCVDGTFMKNI